MYRKPIHTQTSTSTLHWSNDPLDHKLSVVRTHIHRARTIVTEEDRKQEIKYVNKALKSCGYQDCIGTSQMSSPLKTEEQGQ